jgi:adenylate cyclase
VRPIQVYQVGDFLSEEHRSRRRQLSRVGEHVEVNVIDSSNIRAAIAELRGIQEDFEKQFDEG